MNKKIFLLSSILALSIVQASSLIDESDDQLIKAHISQMGKKLLGLTPNI